MTAPVSRAANQAAEAVQGATFLLLCHDDVALDPARPPPGGGGLPVERRHRRTQAGDWDRPEVLLEVGRVIDRFGAPFTGIEPGEVDQEQHDAVRDVFYVTTATMLVRADLFAELRWLRPGHLPRCRGPRPVRSARVARVLVAPGRAAHHRGRGRARRADRPEAARRARRVRILFTSYSFLSLLWLVPFGSWSGSSRRSAICSRSPRRLVPPSDLVLEPGARAAVRAARAGAGVGKVHDSRPRGAPGAAR